IHFLAPNGKYITCGLYDQYTTSEMPRRSGNSDAMTQILLSALVRNLQIVGNCLGTSDDLRAAIQDFDAGTFRVVGDSVFRDGEVGAFLQRTYNERTRFGKVVYQYD